MYRSYVGGDNLIEGIIQLGSAALKERGLLDNIIEELVPEVKGKRRQVFKLNFKTNEIKLELDLDEEMDSETAYKYCFVGSADGANSPQWYASSKGLGYFLNQTVFNLTNIDFGDELNNKIKFILENYFIDLKDESLKRFRYALDLSKLGIDGYDVYEKYKEHLDQGKKSTKFAETLSKDVETFLKDKYGVKLNDFGIFVLCIDGVPLTDYKEYKEAVIDSKKPKIKTSKKEGKNICHICGSSENVSDDLTKTKIKYYTTNLFNFASELNKNKYKRNMQLCENCLNSLLAGETYLMNNLSTKLAKFNVYIIPHFIYGEDIDIKELDVIKDKINTSFNTLINLKDIDSFKQEIDMTLSLNNDDYYFLLNFMFYTKNQASTKVQRLVKDINPGIFDKIGNALISANKKLLKYTGAKEFNLNTVYNMIPVREKSGDVTEYRNILNIYDSILRTGPIFRKKLINDFCKGARIIKRTQDNGLKDYNVSYYSMEGYINRTKIFIKFLEELGCLKEGKGLEVSSLTLRDDLKEYIKSMNYDEQQTALFLLGYLVGEVGNAQGKRLEGKKPILNKLNYNGVDKQKLIRLSNDIHNKLNQEKSGDKPLRVYNESVYYEFKRLFDKNITNWALNKNENLYYILSGYSYASVRPFLKEDEVNE